MAKMTLEELRKLRDTTKAEINRREVEGKEIHVIVGMGTCGIAAGAKETMDAFLKALEEKKLVDSVILRQTGCMGLCYGEPTVEVVAPGMPAVIYGRVDGDVAKKIVDEHLVGRRLLENQILDRPAVDIISK